MTVDFHVIFKKFVDEFHVTGMKELVINKITAKIYDTNGGRVILR